MKWRCLLSSSNAIKYGNSCFYYTHSLQSPTPYCSSLVSFALPSFKVKASACNFHLCSIPSLQQTPQSTQPDSHSAPTNPRVSFSCYFGVSGRIRPKQSVSVQQQPSQNTQLQASLSITHHPLSHPSTTVPEYRTPKCTSYLHCIPWVLVVSFHLPLNIAASIYPA